MARLPHPDTGRSKSKARGGELRQGQWYAWIFWGIVALFFLYEFFIRVTPNVILGELQTDFDATPGSIATAMSVYLWVYAPMQLLVGVLLDRYGSKYIVSTAALICGFGCIIFSQAQGLTFAGLGRGFIGVGSAFAFVGAVYVATVWFPPRQLALIAGITAGVGMIGEVVGQVPVAKLVEDFSWQNVVFYSGIVGLGLGVLMFLVIPRRPSWFEDRFKNDAEAQLGLLKSVGVVLRKKQIWLIGAISAILYLPLSVIAALWGTTYLERTMDIDVTDASTIITMLAVGWLIGCPLAGKLSDLFRNRKFFLMLGSIGGFITMGLFLLSSNMSMTSMMILMLVMGLLTGTQAIAFAVAIENSPRSLAATAVAVCNFLTMLMAAGLQNAVGWILTWIAPSSTHAAQLPSKSTMHPLSKATEATHQGGATAYGDVSISDFNIAIAVIPALFLLSIVLCLFLRETHAMKVDESGSSS